MIKFAKTSGVRPAAAILLCMLLLAVAPGCNRIDADQLGLDTRPITSRDRLYDVSFVSPNEAWAVGYPGIILHSIDGGANWQREQIDTNDALFAVDFADALHGWVVGRGGLVVSTVDGGQTWTSQRIETGQGEGAARQHLFGVEAISPQHAVAVGSFGTVALTLDGGSSWETTFIESMYSAHLFDVSFVDENNGLIVGDYPSWEEWMLEGDEAAALTNIFGTSDGGRSWQPLPVPVKASLYAVEFPDPLHIRAAGRNGSGNSTA